MAKKTQRVPKVAVAPAPAIPDNYIVQNRMVDTLGHVDAVLAFCAIAAAGNGGHSAAADGGLSIILELVRDAVRYEADRLGQGGAR